MKRAFLRGTAALAVALVALPVVAHAELPPLIPRELLFGNPEKLSPALSPDGKRIAYIAPDKGNVLQVWVKTLGQADDKAVTADKKRGIRNYLWAEDNRTLLYLQDGDGDENFHVYGVDLESGNVRDYTPFQGVRANLVDSNPKFPNQILLTLNLRDRKLFDVYRLDLRSGAVELDTQNPGDVAGWSADSALQVRGAIAQHPDGSSEMRVRDNPKAPWRTLATASLEDAVVFNLLGFTPDGKSAYVVSSVGADTGRLLEKNLKTGAEKVLAESPKVDVSDVEIQPTRRVVQAASFRLGRKEWKVLDPSLQPDVAALTQQLDGEFNISSRDQADKTWLVSLNSDRAPQRYYLYDRASKKATLLFSSRPKLEGAPLAEMKFVTIASRDGMELPSYLTLPVGVPAKGLPLVLLVHGGPWGRDTWGYNPTAQWLANRGYAVLQTNFRASTGFGKKFTNAGDRQWGLKMHDDLLDAVDWAVKQGIADPKQVAIMGGSYGGYAALAAAAFTPDVFKAAVDVCGPSNLFTLLGSVPPYWKTMKGTFNKRVGNPEEAADVELLKKASPLFSAERIKIPMLIGQGANDPRVKQAEAEQIVEAIAKNGKKATYVLYSDEGHGFRRAENSVDFNARVEAFLAENLGGRKEPFTGDKVPGSTAVVRVVGGSTQANAAGK